MTHTSLIILAPDVSERGGIQKLVVEVTKSAIHQYGERSVQVLSLPRISRQNETTSSRLRQLGAKVKYSAGALKRAGDKPAAILCLHAGLSPLARIMARRAGCPYAVLCYGIEVWGRLPPTEGWGLRGADELWSISEFTATQLRGHGLSVRRIKVWPLGIPSDLALSGSAGAKWSAPPGRVLCVSRLTRRDAYKGVDVLIMAWPAVMRRFPEAELRIVGDGDMRSSLSLLAQYLGVAASVTFLGSVDNQTLATEYSRARIFALPGRARVDGIPEGEGFGLVFLEAAAMGLPVVAGRAGGAPEALVDQQTGILVDPNDARDVTRALVRLLAEPALANAMGAEGRVWVHTSRSSASARAHLGQLLANLVTRP